MHIKYVVVFVRYLFRLMGCVRCFSLAHVKVVASRHAQPMVLSGFCQSRSKMNKNSKNSYEDEVKMMFDSNSMRANNQPSILIADDHLLLSEALAATLEAFPRLYKTSLVSTLPEALDTLASGEVFDLVLLDLRMLGLKSIIEVINAAAPAKVCLFSDEVDLTIMHLAIDNGASGLIPKTMSVKSFLSVVEFVLSGQIFIPASKEKQRKIDKGGKNSQLNELEIRIVRMTSEGAINKEIATVIGVSEMTVKMHMRLICSKLNARNRAHAVTMARQYGLL